MAQFKKALSRIFNDFPGRRIVKQVWEQSAKNAQFK
jgi:hypothetical protein